MAGKSVLKLVNFLVDFFDGGSTSGSGSTSTWHTSRHTPRGASCGLVQLSDDGVADTFNLLLFILVFILLSSLIGIKPSNNFITFVILSLEFLGISHHFFNVFLGQTSLV